MGFDDTPESYGILLDQIREIKQSMNEDDSLSAIIETDILLKTLTEEFIKEHEFQKLQEQCDSFLKNPTNNRILRLNQRIKGEIDTAIEYYDQDIGSDERLFYQEELETDLLEAYSEIRRLLAIIIKTKLRENLEI